MPCYLDSAYVNIINDIYSLYLLLFEASFHCSTPPTPAVAKLYLTLGDPKDCMDATGFPVLHYLPEFAENSCPLSQ